MIWSPLTMTTAIAIMVAATFAIVTATACAIFIAALRSLVRSWRQS